MDAQQQDVLPDSSFDSSIFPGLLGFEFDPTTPSDAFALPCEPMNVTACTPVAADNPASWQEVVTNHDLHK
jgi:hypothetical protein